MNSGQSPLLKDAWTVNDLLVFWGGGAGLWHVIYQVAELLRIPIGLVSAGRGQLIP